MSAKAKRRVGQTRRFMDNKGRQGVVEMKNDKNTFSCQGVRLLHPEIAELVGTNSALLCSQIAFWSRHTKHRYNDQEIFYKSLSDWLDEFPWLGKTTIYEALEKLRSEKLIRVYRGVLPGIGKRTPCYSLNFDHPAIRKCFGSESEATVSESESIGSESEPTVSESEPKNAGSLTAPKVPGPLRASRRKTKELAAAPLPPDEDQTQEIEAWLESLDERERISVNHAIDREIEKRGDSFRSLAAFRVLLLGDFMRGDREMPDEIDETQHEMIQSFKKLFDGGDEAVPAVKVEDAEPIQTEVLMSYDEEMVQLYENMEENHVCH